MLLASRLLLERLPFELEDFLAVRRGLSSPVRIDDTLPDDDALFLVDERLRDVLFAGWAMVLPFSGWVRCLDVGDGGPE